MFKKKNYNSILKSAGNAAITTLVIVLIAFVAGTLFGSLLVAKSIGGGSISSGGSFADGWNAAKVKLKSSNLPGMMLSEIKSLNGQVRSVNSDKIVFSSPLINPLWDDSLKTRTAVISGDTVITIHTQISAEKRRANQKAGQEKNTALRAEIEALNVKLVKCLPSEIIATSTCGQVRQKINNLQEEMVKAQRLAMDVFEETTGVLTDIVVGDSITVISSQNISEKSQFTATQVVVEKNLPLVAPSAPAVNSAVTNLK